MMLLADSGDPDHMPHSASDLGLHYLPFAHFGGLQTKMGY